jgi:hypothetical protein
VQVPGASGRGADGSAPSLGAGESLVGIPPPRLPQMGSSRRYGGALAVIDALDGLAPRGGVADGVADACDNLSFHALATGVPEYGGHPRRRVETGRTKLKNLVSTVRSCPSAPYLSTISGFSIGRNRPWCGSWVADGLKPEVVAASQLAASSASRRSRSCLTARRSGVAILRPAGRSGMGSGEAARGSPPAAIRLGGLSSCGSVAASKSYSCRPCTS